MQSHGSSGSVVSHSYWDKCRFLIQEALQNVRTMKLNFRLGDLEPYPPSPDSMLYQIISFLGAAPQVETLKLSFYSTDNVILGDDIMGAID